jgi:transposase
LTDVYRCGADGETKKIAEGFERSERLTAVVDGEEHTWVERRLVVRSLSHAKSSEAALQRRLERTQSAIEALNVRKQGKTPFTEMEALPQAAETILHKRNVEGLLVLQYAEQVQERQVRQYGERPAETRIERQVSVTVQRDETAIQEAIQRLGWRVYGANSPQEELSLEKAILAYREEYLVERSFGRLKGKPLSLTPMYLQDDRRATALIRLLSIGLRVLNLLKHVARSHLAETGEKLRGLYAGNPTRATDRPTAEALLRAFEGIYLSFVTFGEQTYRHLTPFCGLQHKILSLLAFSADIYTNLAANSANPP